MLYNTVYSIILWTCSLLDQIARLMLSFSWSFMVMTVRLPDQRALSIFLGPLRPVITAQTLLVAAPGISLDTSPDMTKSEKSYGEYSRKNPADNVLVEKITSRAD